MKTKSMLSIALALALSGTAAAKRFETDVAFDRAAGDLVPSTLVASKAAPAPGMNLETRPVQFSWELPADQKNEAQQPFVRESKEYWTRVPSAELARGTTLHTTAKGALIRLSPVSSDAMAVQAISADDVVLTANGKAIQGRAAMANAANDAELKMAGTDFPDGTLAFQLRDDLGAGAITLAMPKAAGDYLVHVYEPNSTEVLKLTMDRIVASHGQTYKVFANYNGTESLDSIDGLVSAPNGASFDLSFKRAAMALCRRSRARRRRRCRPVPVGSACLRFRQGRECTARCQDRVFFEHPARTIGRRCQGCAERRRFAVDVVQAARRRRKPFRSARDPVRHGRRQAASGRTSQHGGHAVIRKRHTGIGVR
jgi:hypothetical protein